MVLAILTVGGTAYDVTQRGAARARMDAWGWNLGGPSHLEFSQFGKALPAPFLSGTAVSLSLGGTNYFSGEIVSVENGFSAQRGWGFGYRCQGLEYRALNLTFTGSDGTDTQAYNLAPDDPYYLSSSAGKTVGQILVAAITLHTAALTAIGITSYTAGDFTGGYMDIVPPDPVYVTGDRFWSALTGVTARWAKNHSPYITPAGVIRCVDTRALTAKTLTMGSDLIDPPALSRDTSDNATAIVIRGRADVQPAILNTYDGSLVESFNATDKAAWNWSKYTRPGNASDNGTCTVLTSTTISCTSANTSQTYGAGVLSGMSAWLLVTNTAQFANIQAQEMYPITGNTVMSAGTSGTMTVTIAVPLANSGYNKYQIMAQPSSTVVGTATPGDCWRRYTIAATWAAQHLVARFPKPVPFSNSTTVVATNYPTACVSWSNTGLPPYVDIFWPFEIDASHGQIRFVQPVVKAFGAQADLDTGGFTTRTATNGVPAQVKVMLPYSRGALTVRRPATGYTGTAFSVDGISRERPITSDGFQWAGDTPSIQLLGDMYLDAAKDTIVEGKITYYGQWADGLAPGSCVNVAGTAGATPYSTGWMSTMAAPVRGCTFSWADGQPCEIVTTINVSTRRETATGDRLYVHPAFRSLAIMEDLMRGGSNESPLVIGSAATTANIGSGMSFNMNSSPASNNPADYGLNLTSGFEGGGPRANDSGGSMNQPTNPTPYMPLVQASDFGLNPDGTPLPHDSDSNA